MTNFISFLLKKVYSELPIAVPETVLQEAVKKAAADIRYHYPKLSDAQILSQLQTNTNELAVFLFRISREVFMRKESIPDAEQLISALAWIMKECCACEIYASNDIDTGFYVVHSAGMVMGSRNKIGKGFQIFQGCTIGHRYDFEDGCKIGDQVIMYPNSAVIGPVSVGSDSVIGRNCMVTKDVAEKVICHGPVFETTEQKEA